MLNKVYYYREAFKSALKCDNLQKNLSYKIHLFIRGHLLKEKRKIIRQNLLEEGRMREAGMSERKREHIYTQQCGTMT